jgi:Arc/MetJ-type ribon-helix-helix transcriptional regulator
VLGTIGPSRVLETGIAHTGAHPALVLSWAMATEQIAVRLPVQLLGEIDELVARGVYESRAAAVRAGVEAVAASERRRQLDQAVIEGYRRRPASAAEHEAALASLRDAILEEPW